MESLLKHVSAVIVTKGDVDLGPILHSLPFEDVVVWDNSERQDLKVYGRYAAIAEAKNDVIFTQDDDTLLDAAAIVAHYEPAKVICNMPQAKRDEYSAIAPNVGLVGWGACFDRSLTDVLYRYLERYGQDDLFLRECDRVFTQLNDIKCVEVPFRSLPCAHFANRMGSERRHLADLEEIIRRIGAL